MNQGPLDQAVSPLIGMTTTEVHVPPKSTFTLETLSSRNGDEAIVLASPSAHTSTDAQETNEQLTSRPASHVVDEQTVVTSVYQPDNSLVDSDLGRGNEQPGGEPASPVDDALKSFAFNVDSSSKDDESSETQPPNETDPTIMRSYPCDIVDGTEKPAQVSTRLSIYRWMAISHILRTYNPLAAPTF